MASWSDSEPAHRGPSCVERLALALLILSIIVFAAAADGIAAWLIR